MDEDNLDALFQDDELVGDAEEYCKPPAPVDQDVMEGYSCSAGHTAGYISPYGDVFPCVQFPLPTGNVRRQKFADIWYDSPQMNEVRSIKVKDLTVCSSCTHAGSCTRCPGLAYMEGSMRGPSTSDCMKSYPSHGHPDGEHAAQGSDGVGRAVSADSADGGLVGLLPKLVRAHGRSVTFVTSLLHDIRANSSENLAH